MPLQDSGFLDRLTPRLLAEADKRLSADEAAVLKPFLGQYYQQAATGEFKKYPIGDLYGAVISHWQFGRVRRPERPLVHVYNPDYEKHGWQSTHTVVEVVTDDMPFLVDSVSMVLNRNNMTIHHTLHPVFVNRRNRDGRMMATLDADDARDDCVTESYMQVHVDRVTDPKQLKALTAELLDTLLDVRLAVGDWKPMRDAVLELSSRLAANGDEPHPVSREAADLLAWIEDNHFTLLGYCEFESDGADLRLVQDSPLGVLTRGGLDEAEVRALALPCSARDFLDRASLLTVTKTNHRSTVHRPAYVDLIGVLADAGGGATRLHCILGLFTSAAYNRNTREIPYLRTKMARIMERSRLPRDGHLEKALQNIIETFPRDTLFQVPEDRLEPILGGILHLQERQHTRVFVANEPFGRFHSCLVYVPKERFHSDLRIKIGGILLNAFDGASIEFNVHFSESVLARIHYLVHAHPEATRQPDLESLAAQIEDAALSWSDRLRDALVERMGEENGVRRYNVFRDAFPGGYQDDYSPRRACHDIQRIEDALASRALGIYFYRPVDVMDASVRLRLYSHGHEVSLSDVVPMIEDMGLKVIGENPYRVTPDGFGSVWIHDFTLVDPKRRAIDVEAHRRRFEETFAGVWDGSVESDGFNRLVLSAGLDCRECTMLRAYARFLKQIRIRYSQDYIIETLTGNPHMSDRLVRYFHHRMRPDWDDAQPREVETAAVRLELEEGLERVLNLDEDRILSAFINLIESTLRTNYYQLDENRKLKPWLSFKFDSKNVLRMPEPRPMYEIYVYSPRVEAVHLRGGKVARGGLRWSDRPEDFRTEVLGLVKAQMVKNAVIVPVGSKGGFVVKQAAGEGEQRMEEVVDCYKIFISGMLDVTDNVSGDEVVHPPRVVRHDGDDPYLVVAADKGTATFSDVANGVAIDYGFWLGDAFASGGSTGYDHKGMGITARGAWESVKRHFRELGTDVQSQDFTVIGIGDMGGDVFGNGMLLSEHVRLVGAFNHRHVFLDPDPDPAVSYKERKRLFKTPGAGWDDYDKTLVSRGGGVFSRAQKSIRLSEEARAALGVNLDTPTPNELINAMLKAPVDLVWNGGIGTYVKGMSESNEQVRDRANDALRVNGSELRCKVFGEGGNLGMTQLGRIEFNRKGGLCYTDAIDNSAGVDTSDHEVNIKILLDRCVAAGDLTVKQRNGILQSMTDEVGELVLRDNYGQTRSISAAADQAPALMRQHMRFVRALEKEGVLDRALEFLPDDDTAAARIQDNEGLCRAELSVLLAYSKLTLNDRLIASNVPEDPFLSVVLHQYFPALLGEKFPAAIAEHPLKREIIVTHIVNDMVNRVGPTFAYRLKELTGVSEAHIARAYTVTTEIFGLRDLWRRIEATDNQVPDASQKRMLHDISELIERSASWLARNRPENMNIRDAVNYFKDGVTELVDSYPRTLAPSNRVTQRRCFRELSSAGVDTELAQRVSYMAVLSPALDIIDVARDGDAAVPTTAALYYALGDRLGIHWLRDKVSELRVRNHWQAMASFSLRNELHLRQKELTARALHSGGDKGRDMLNAWMRDNRAACERFASLIADFKASRDIDFAMLSVAISEAKALQL